MVFSAPTFLFIFLPIVLVLVLLAPRSMRNLVLLAASLFFYAWGEAAFVFVMLASIGFNYAVGLFLEPRAESPAPTATQAKIPQRGRKVLFAAAVGGNLLLLCWFKYAGFVVENGVRFAETFGFPALDLPVDQFEAIHLPIGISFFTFQAISYLVDVYRGEHPAQRRPIDLALFIALFPQLIAGPIVRYKEISHQLRERVIDLTGCADGVHRFTVGLAKKLLVANTLAVPADAIFALPAAELDPSVAWFGAICYALQIYFDFSGYSDMAIGLGHFFGFTIPENFNRPYRAESLTDFWRRWHLSLSRWFRDYLYIPLGGNRRGPARTYANLMIVFVLCGLWHGASWTFLVWGLMHGVLLMIERAGLAARLVRLPRLLRHFYCLGAVLFAWVVFRAETLASAFDYIAAMWGASRGIEGVAQPMIADFVSLEVSGALLIGAIWASGALDEIFSGFWNTGNRSESANISWSASIRYWASTPALVGLWFALGMKLASRTYDPFLYFRF